MPSLLAASRVERIFIATTSVADSVGRSQGDIGLNSRFNLDIAGQPSIGITAAIAFSIGV